MGNNLYANVLSYGDWVKLNNAQRQHEVGYESMMVLFPNAFICALSYPRYTSWCLGTFLAVRLLHINGYSNFRGFNKAMVWEEMLKVIMSLIIIGGFASSMRITGIPKFVMEKVRYTGMFTGKSRIAQRMQKFRKK